MFRFTSFCLLLALQVVKSELPMKCKGPPPDISNPKECCDIPMIFKEEDFKDCNIEKYEMFKKGNIDCSKHVCLFNKYKLMKDDTTVDTEAFSALLDSWTDTNSDFKDVAGKIKENCLVGELPGPPEICQTTKVILCSFITAFMDCPRWKDSDDCNKLKDHMKECRPH